MFQDEHVVYRGLSPKLNELDHDSMLWLLSNTRCLLEVKMLPISLFARLHGHHAYCGTTYCPLPAISMDIECPASGSSTAVLQYIRWIGLKRPKCGSGAKTLASASLQGWR